MRVRLFVLLAAFYLLIGGREPPYADPHIVWDTAVALVETGSPAITTGGPSFFFMERGGKRYGIYPLGNAIAQIPGYLVQKALAALPSAPGPRLLLPFATHVVPSLVTAGTCVLFFSILLRQGVAASLALLVSLALGLTTILCVYARLAFSEALQTCLLTAATLAVLRAEERPSLTAGAIGGFVCGWLWNSKAINALAIAVLLAYLVWRLRATPRALGRVVAGAAVAFVPWAALLLWHNAVRSGSPFNTGYGEAIGGIGLFEGRLLEGFYGLTLSPGRSVFFFSPVLLVALAGWSRYFVEHRAHARLALALVLAIAVPHMMFPVWWAGGFWGPRYLVAVTPLLLLPAGPWLQAALANADRAARATRVALVSVLATVGLAVQYGGCAIFYDFWSRIAAEVPAKGVPEGFGFLNTVYYPQLSQIVGHLWLVWLKLTEPAGPVPAARTPWRWVAPNQDLPEGRWREVPWDFWFDLWRRDANGLRWALVIAALLLAAMVWAGYGLWRRARQGTQPAQAVAIQ